MAGFNIWATDPDNKPRERAAYSDDTVGKISAGYQEFDERSKRMVPKTLTEWRFATADPKVANAVAQLFGGSPVENEETQSEQFIDVFSEAPKLPVIIEQDGISADMKQWYNGKLVHHCDGQYFKSHPRGDELIGRPCGCPTLFAERKQADKDGMGPKPSIEVKFRLADDPELGIFKFTTGSWTLAAVLHEALDKLERVGVAALASLELEHVEFVGKNGPMRGKTVSYTKPVIRVLKAYDDAIADEPNGE